MHKGEFIDYIIKHHDLSKANSEQIIDVFVNSVTSALSEGHEISLIGFGKFYSRKVDGREGRNPSNGEKMQIPAHVRPGFLPGSNLKSACNGKKIEKKTDKKLASKKPVEKKSTTAKKK